MDSFIQMTSWWRGGRPYLYDPAMALDHFIHRLTWEFNLIALLMPFDYTRNVTQLCTCNLCALCPGGVLDCLPKSNQSLWKMCDKFSQHTPHPVPPFSLSPSMLPPHSLCDTQWIAWKLIHISLCKLIIICIQTGQTKKQKKQRG